jgi:hypothetical protein
MSKYRNFVGNPVYFKVLCIACNFLQKKKKKKERKKKENKCLTLHFQTNQKSGKSGNLEIRNQQPDTGQKPLLQIHNIYMSRGTYIFRERFTLIGSNGGH